MSTPLTLLDLIAPYILGRENLTEWADLFDSLRITEFSQGQDGDGATVRGIASLPPNGRLTFDWSRRAFTITSGSPPSGAGQQQNPILDFSGAQIPFALSASRQGAAGFMDASTAAGAAFASGRAVLEALDAPPLDAPTSDFPGSRFQLDMTLEGAVLHLPFLKGAQVAANGMLERNTSKPDVKARLPKLKLRLQQASDFSSGLTLDVVSAGAAGLDEDGDIGAAELVSMDPPYAFCGDSTTVGFAFRSAVLDLSDGFTPPAILSKFGFDETFRGLYFPEIRIYVAAESMDGFAVSAGVTDLLIGWGPGQDGVSGDFDAAVVNMGPTGALSIRTRFYGADGHGYRTTLGSEGATAAIPEGARIVVDVQGGRPPYDITTEVLDAGGAVSQTLNGVSGTINFGGRSQLDLRVRARERGGANRTAMMMVRVTLRAPTGAASAAGGGGPAAVALQDARIVDPPNEVQGRRLRLENSNQASVRLSLSDNASGVIWRIGSNPPSAPSGSIDAPVAAGATVTVEARIPARTAPGNLLTVYFREDRPRTLQNENTQTFARDPSNTHGSPAIENPGTMFAGGPSGIDAIAATLAALPNGSALRINGYASFERNRRESEDYSLAQNRAQAAQWLIEAACSDPSLGGGVLNGRSFTFTRFPGDGMADFAAWRADWAARSGNRNTHWKAEIVLPPATTQPEIVITGQITRPATPTPAVPAPVADVPPEPASPPDWFRSIALKVRIVRNDFVACELIGEVDFETAAEGEFRRDGGTTAPPNLFSPSNGSAPDPTNTADGIVKYRLFFTIDQASGNWDAVLALGADPADTNGLLMTGYLPGQETNVKDVGRNALGLATIFAPVLTALPPPADAAGDMVELAAFGATIGVMANLDWFRVQRVILFGGELGSSYRPGAFKTHVLFDVEAAISAQLSLGGTVLVRIPDDKPVVVRYKAIGYRVEETAGNPPFRLRPLFDSSKGYTIDMSRPGTIQVAEPLGSILQVLGARIARNNPVILEITLGAAIDLGVISLDRLGLRIPLDPPGDVQLTALGVGVNVPGALEGRGLLEIKRDPDEIRGEIDITLTPIRLRIAARIRLADIRVPDGRRATGVLVTLEIELPPPGLLLGSSGLSILGFTGLFAMHFKRNEEPYAALNTPALAWLRATGGDPTKQDFWGPQLDRWSFGVGALLGTPEGGVVLSLKGMFLLELPGPRILLMMKAKILSPPPKPLKGTAEGNIMAVLDLDFGRNRFTIGLAAEYSINPILSVSLPVEAFFDLNDAKNWHLYIGSRRGTAPGPIHAQILEVFEGSGYLMFSGHGLLPTTGGVSGRNIPGVSGFAIGAGLHVSMVWGNVDIGLYLRVQAGFDAVLGFEPLYVNGVLYIRGELRLFIISIAAYAELQVEVGERQDANRTKVARIDGEICGEIDFFFFTVKGCVRFNIGGTTPISIPPPKLVKEVILQSRTPALVFGTGTDRPIDGALGTALAQTGAPAMDAAGLPTVPIDSIPVVTFTAGPRDNGATFFGNALYSFPDVPADGWVKHGDQRVRYDLTAIALNGPIGPGDKPATWWRLSPPLGNPTDPPDAHATACQLALLSWVPDATPNAMERNESLSTRIRDRWGGVCRDAAPAAAVLWTFREEALGPSETGWRLTGQAWPDPANTGRSQPANLITLVDERWRSGDLALDLMRGVIPAQVEGFMYPCAPRKQPNGPGATTPTAPSTPGTVAPSPVNTVTVNAAGANVGVVSAGGDARMPIEALKETDVHGIGTSRVQETSKIGRERLALDPAIEDRIATGLRRTIEAPALDRFETDRRLVEQVVRDVAGRSDPNPLKDGPAIGFDEAVRRAIHGQPFLREDVLRIDPDLLRAIDALRPTLSDRPTETDRRIGDDIGDTRINVRDRDLRDVVVRDRDIVRGRDVATGPVVTGPVVTGPVVTGPVVTGPGTPPTPPPVAPPAPVAPPPPMATCAAKALAAPMHDGDDPFRLINDPETERGLIEALQRAGVALGPLDDAVHLHLGAIEDGRVLLFVRENLLKASRIVVRALDGSQNEVWRHVASVADMTPPKAFPPRWLDPGGVWIDDFTDAIVFYYYLYLILMRMDVNDRYVPILIDLPKIKDAALFEVGVARANTANAQKLPRGIELRAFYVSVIEATQTSEAERFKFDDSMIRRDRAAVSNVLAAGSTQYALLAPNTLYSVRADWTAETAAGTASDSGVFWFKTDDVSPRRIDNWMLCTTPEDNEAHLFIEDRVRLVFATNNLVQLYDAYGERLEAKLAPSSFRNPVSTPDQPHPIPLSTNVANGWGQVEGVQAAVLSPFEDTLIEVLGETTPMGPRAPCINTNVDRESHSMVTLKIPLDPYTDYLLDVDAVSKTNAAQRKRVYRMGFSTGGYRNAAAMAQALSSARMSHRASAPGAMAAIHAHFAGRDPEGPELDAQLRLAGIEPLALPDRARVVVFWERGAGSAPPQPAAVMVEAPEPMWRSRFKPTKQASTLNPAGLHRWVMQRHAWLKLESTAATASLVRGVVKAPGGCRGIIVLNPAARGERLHMELVRTAFTEPYLDGAGAVDQRMSVFDYVFAGAPWEDEP